MKPKINPEWEALEGKPHLVPLNCVPDQYKMIKLRPPNTCEPIPRWRCNTCGKFLEECNCDIIDTP